MFNLVEIQGVNTFEIKSENLEVISDLVKIFEYC